MKICVCFYVSLFNSGVQRNMIFIHYHVSSFCSGSGTARSPELLTGTKLRPSPPPGLTPHAADEGRTGLKGTDSRPLEKVFNTVFYQYKTNPF